MSASMKRNLSYLSALAMLVVAGGVYYASLDNGPVAAPTAPTAPAVPVTVQTLAPQKIRVWSEFSGRLQAVDAAEIRPEVSGRITEIHFQDGQNVKAGDVLFVIDPRPYEAAVAKAEANLASAKTNAQFAKAEFERAEGMTKNQTIAQRVYDERANNNRMAMAAVKVANAEMLRADIDLDHAYVKAPISGRVSRAEITVGNLVQAGGNAPLLTTVVSNQTIYADFEVDEQTYMQGMRASANASEEERLIPVQLTVQGDKDHTYKGTIHSFDNRINTATGTIRARAKFDNKDGALVPGMFVTLNVGNSTDQQVLLVPDRAIGFDQNKKFVYIVGEDNKVAYREIELGKQVQAQRVVLKGLEAGDRIIVDGVQHVRPDVLVDAKEETSATEPSPESKENLVKK